jgi:hypothetical protein
MGEERENILMERVDDHEVRIRQLEMDSLERKVQYAEISKSQSDLKLLVMESNKTLKESNDKMLEAILGNNTVKNDIKLKDRKEIWGIISLIIGALITYFTTR